ncbi:MAG: glycosyltransferase [Propionibacteriaceae bacterium]|jgi:glycosyltransferase involved in cell wall biosynthesis|nr:glycosyltransferase [Propionibacteriaceae bacterium]
MVVDQPAREPSRRPEPEALLVSVVVPVHDALEGLDRCVESLLGQTHRRLEIILVDDGSTDGSSGLCDWYAERDERIIALHQSNAGPSRARNVGLSRMTGDYVTFVDSDDLVSPHYVERLLGEALDSEADCVAGGYSHVSSGGDEPPVAKIPTFSFPEAGGIGPVRRLLVDADLLGVVAVKLYRAAFIRRYRLFFPEDIWAGEDMCFNLTAFGLAARVGWVGESLYSYIQRPGSLVNQPLGPRTTGSRLACVRRVSDYVTINYPQLDRELTYYRTNALLSLINGMVDEGVEPVSLWHDVADELARGREAALANPTIDTKAKRRLRILRFGRAPYLLSTHLYRLMTRAPRRSEDNSRSDAPRSGGPASPAEIPVSSAKVSARPVAVSGVIVPLAAQAVSPRRTSGFVVTTGES